MNDGLKQRIIGALVLVALGIIFVPVIFDKERIVPVDRTTQVPPEPDIVAIPLPEPPVPPREPQEEIAQPIDGEFRIENDEPEAEQKDDVEEQVKNSPKSLTQSEPSLQAWVLQIASYKNSQRAEELRDTLISQGQQAFVKDVSTSAGTRTRLYIGPTINKTDLEKIKVDIDRRYGVDSIISKFKP